MKSTTNNNPTTDPRLSRVYCNDPEAVNYNWNFPGTPDNTTCFYPTEVFNKAYTFNDSVYFSDGTFLFTKSYTLHFYALDKEKLAIVGFCTSGDSLRLTADRFYHAQLDSTNDAGQQLCRVQDTVSGTIIQNKVDSALLQINFTVLSDTGLTYHRGTAVKL
jgi:outer membrane protein assembly factor BamB